MVRTVLFGNSDASRGCALPAIFVAQGCSKWGAARAGLFDMVWRAPGMRKRRLKNEKAAR